MVIRAMEMGVNTSSGGQPSERNPGFIGVDSRCVTRCHCWASGAEHGHEQ